MSQSGVIISKNGFKCAYCGKQRIGAYKIVDDGKSCERCNRRYDPPPNLVATCPTCNGDGYLEADTSPRTEVEKGT